MARAHIPLGAPCSRSDRQDALELMRYFPSCREGPRLQPPPPSGSRTIIWPLPPSRPAKSGLGLATSPGRQSRSSTPDRTCLAATHFGTGRGLPRDHPTPSADLGRYRSVGFGVSESTLSVAGPGRRPRGWKRQGPRRRWWTPPQAWVRDRGHGCAVLWPCLAERTAASGHPWCPRDWGMRPRGQGWAGTVSGSQSRPSRWPSSLGVWPRVATGERWYPSSAR